jgi:Zn-dependent protease
MAAEDPWAGSRAPRPVQKPGGRWRFGISLNFLFLIAICVALGLALVFVPAITGIFTFLFIAAGWVLSVVLHEFGHAFIAWRAGDTTVVRKGYLTLDPLKYTDLTTTLVFPLIALAIGGIGFPGAAVYLRPDLMRSRLWRSLSSLAGPAMTGVVLVALSFGVEAAQRAPALAHAMAFLAFLQATALILNLLPVPGLDGYGVIRPFLPLSLQRSMRKWERVGMILLLGALFIVPGVSLSLIDAALVLTDGLGIPRPDIGTGMAAFRFWRFGG